MFFSDNLLLKTDSYKVTHWKQYPPKTQKVYSYLESRGGKFPYSVFFGLQYILKRHLAGVQVTPEKIDQAEAFWRKHFGADWFNRSAWEYILEHHKGYLPVRIKAVHEGTKVENTNVLMTIENTDPECYWLTNYLETLLVQVWYPITVATNSFASKQVIMEYLRDTSESIETLDYKLHDFGFRGVSCWEQAAVGSAAHLLNFRGTDNSSGIQLLQKYYGADVCGFSIPASEHSTITSWGEANEEDAYQNMLEQYSEGNVACVSDSFNIFYAVDKVWGVKLREKILERNGTLMIRPDSGDPVEVNLRLLEILWARFGGRYNSKGYKEIDPHVRLIQGDAVNLKTIKKILRALKTNRFSTDNIAFGSGGGLLQRLNRDTLKFAMK
ncbi:MAG: nicotinate phosphoribosyltransferase, partial [Cytophagales bacterium]|nr:nicotinate phosphoribosyltransferase [Cytophagales bacterium]